MTVALLRKRILGVLFICILLLGVWVVNGVFTQKFTSFDRVKLDTDTIGLQLPSNADVKVRGVIVGQVLKASSDANGAVLTLGIKPSEMKTIPANVTASILPKTLFGEKYVELVIPPRADSTSLTTGARITQTKLPVEVEALLNNIYPLLRSIQPAELNYTLNALATALEGRGQAIGENIEVLDSYLKRLNPQVPQLVSDLRLLSSVSSNYADVVPQIAATLRNTVKTGNTLVTKQAKLNKFLKDVGGLSDTARGFLDANGQNIISLGQLSSPQLALLKRYSPTFPCLLRGIVKQVPQLGSTFRGFVFHINLKTLPYAPRAYGVQDLPILGATNAPNCAGLPNPPIPYRNQPNFNDGVDDLGRHDGQRAPTGFDRSSRLLTGSAGTAQDQAVINSLTGPVLGLPADQVPGLVTLLFGPMAAGTEVSAQ